MADADDPSSGSVNPPQPSDDPISFGPEEQSERWDANDPRRQNDSFAPPTEPCECYCLHCGRSFSSDLIWFQRVIGAKDGMNGFWMCPTPNCDGAGFTFDIFPTDPHHPANSGWQYFDDDDEDYGEDAFDEKGDYIEPEDRQYNPDEPKYKELDDEMLEDDDLEGEEWKFGLSPGERPFNPEPTEKSEAQLEWEEEQKRYDAPDERPREIPWEEPPSGSSGTFKDDDIPF